MSSYRQRRRQAAIRCDCCEEKPTFFLLTEGGVRLDICDQCYLMLFSIGRLLDRWGFDFLLQRGEDFTLVQTEEEVK